MKELAETPDDELNGMSAYQPPVCCAIAAQFP
jgi:hypothetical protein